MNRTIFLPQTLYILMPWMCFGIATVSIGIESSVFKWFCIVLLYIYACYIWALRARYRKY